MVPPTASSSVLVCSASSLGHDLLIAHLEEKRDAWGLSAYSSLARISHMITLDFSRAGLFKPVVGRGKQVTEPNLSH